MKVKYVLPPQKPRMVSWHEYIASLIKAGLTVDYEATINRLACEILRVPYHPRRLWIHDIRELVEVTPEELAEYRKSRGL